MENQVAYTSIPQHDVKFGKGEDQEGLPPYMPSDEESLMPPRQEEDPESCSTAGLFWGNLLSMMFCFWPAALIGLVFTVKARVTSSDRAKRYLSIAKKCLWVSFIVGAVCIVVTSAVQIGFMAHMAKRLYRSGVKGYVAGAYDGEIKGALDAKGLLVNGQPVKFPEHIPGAVNVFDIGSPFWVEIQNAEDMKGAARLVGYSFGHTDGYKKGFCSTEKADCTGVSMQLISDRVDCEYMKAKMERMRAKYIEKMQKEKATPDQAAGSHVHGEIMHHGKKHGEGHHDDDDD